MKEVPDFTGDNNGENYTLYFTKPTVYSICSEGALYSSPRYVDGSFDPENWVEVDFQEVLECDGTVYHMFLTAVQDCLVTDAIHDSTKGYYLSKGA